MTTRVAAGGAHQSALTLDDHASRGGRCPPVRSTVAVDAAHRLRCAARSGVAPRNSLHSLRSLRSDRRGELDFWKRAARADPGRCAARRLRFAPCRTPPAALAPPWHADERSATAVV